MLPRPRAVERRSCGVVKLVEVMAPVHAPFGRPGGRSERPRFEPFALPRRLTNRPAGERAGVGVVMGGHGRPTSTPTMPSRRRGTARISRSGVAAISAGVSLSVVSRSEQPAPTRACQRAVGQTAPRAHHPPSEDRPAPAPRLPAELRPGAVTTPAGATRPTRLSSGRARRRVEGLWIRAIATR